METENLTVDEVEGVLWRRTEGERLEPCGHIEDVDYWPPGLEPECEVLLERWRRDGEYGRQCVATARWTYETLSLPGAN